MKKLILMFVCCGILAAGCKSNAGDNAETTTADETATDTAATAIQQIDSLSNALEEEKENIEEKKEDLEKALEDLPQ